MVDLQKLKYWADVLEREIEIHRYYSKDVDALAKFQPLVESLKKLKITLSPNHTICPQQDFGILKLISLTLISYLKLLQLSVFY